MISMNTINVFIIYRNSVSLISFKIKTYRLSEKILFNLMNYLNLISIYRNVYRLTQTHVKLHSVVQVSYCLILGNFRFVLRQI